VSFPCPVPRCELFASEWGVCRSCAGALARDLGSVPSLVADVEATLARQTGQAPRYGPRSTCPPLAYDPRASAALGALKAVLVGWVRVLAEDTTEDWPADTAAGCASWLLVRVPRLRVHPAAGDVVAEVSERVGACWRAIDRAPALWFAGPCTDCDAPMYTRPEALIVVCRLCAASYPTEGRRRFLLESARDYRLTIPELGRALLVPAATLRSWHRRGRLSPDGEADGQVTYRIGDVLDLLTA